MPRPSSPSTAPLLGLLLACSPPAGGISASDTATASESSATGTTGATTGDTGDTGDSDSEPATTGDPPGPCYGDPQALGPAPRPWDRGQPAIDGCLTRGVRDYRAIVHLHSPHSHDACDGDPQPGGALDESCLADLREGLCRTRTDVAFLTDHPAHADGVPFAELVLTRGDDRPVVDGDGRTIANWIVCPEGHEVLLIPGIESGSMMPLGLVEHAPPGTYGQSTPGSFAAIREREALAWVAHTEGRDPEELATLGLDGVEFYQLHANLDPTIRAEDLGLDPAGFLDDVFPFFFPSGGGTPPEPDLAPLGFLVPNEPSITTFEFLGQSQRLALSAGSDAHQNVLPTDAPDGERIDSYRRMLRWFNNRLRIAGPLTVASAKAALATGRIHIVFESLGTPQGFDFYAEAAGENPAPVEFGGEVTLTPGLTLKATLPTLDPRSPQGSEAPVIEGRLYRATADGREALATWQPSDGPLSAAVPGPGVYRVEVWITPHHLTPYLGDSPEPYRSRQLPWIYSGAIFVRPAAAP